MLFKRKPREEGPPIALESAQPAGGDAAILRDELGLHHLWYLELRLREELARAARSDHVFSLAAWQPRLLPGDVLSPELLRQASEVIAGKLRAYDVAARVDNDRFVALLLDADYPSATTVAYRIKSDIQIRAPGAKWRAGVATFRRDGVDGDALIQVAFRRLEEEAQVA